MPIGILTSGLRAVIEGHDNFKLAAILRAISGVVFIILPAALGLFFGSTTAIGLGFFAARILVFFVYLHFERVFIGCVSFRASMRPNRLALNEVIRVAGWLGVSTLVGSSIAYADRFALALSSTLSQAALYAAPFELLSRLLIIPGAIVTVVFPKLSRQALNPGAAAKLARQSLLASVCLTAPIAVAVGYFSGPLLSVWLGPSFDRTGVPVVQLLCAGMVCNAAAQVSVAALQATGRPDIPARLHLIEFVPSVFLYITFTSAWGAQGTALAWSTRAFIDFALMEFSLFRHFSAMRINSSRC